MFTCRRIIGAFSLLFSSVALAEKTPTDWLDSMSLAHQTLNFTIPMVHLEPNSAQTYLFEHGVSNDRQVVYIAALSGPVRHSYRVDNVVTYMEPESRPYSINAAQIIGPSPAIFVGKVQHILDNYTLTMIEKGRIAGRVTQLIRLKAKDNNRFNYILWLDVETKLLLRYDLFDLNNNLIEQVQAVGLHLNERPSDNIEKLAAQPKHETVMLPSTAQDNWRFSWLPAGFEVKASDEHRVVNTAQNVDYLMLSDGLTQVSVYVANAQKAELPARLQTNNGLSVANFRRGLTDITVIGRIPYETALKIAQSIEPKG
ncbi:MucB/RseB C-terminal domain-containing protein [Psychrobium sp. MM17-31]|uniref:MucB/RseB C-terminal domain-containing protein n=1 Tax=Psychrobium sp. MM17-31 TaxID=2917758 RepID=UPI001EF52022|nr:MucB/RseB C-terminal domain-containing protein [Psychrobium sp. MM17-31]MCG7530955.1 MucB/RseB C-terminal domain-containing protein [Psychrobium sp. MM17-31]